MKAPTPLNEHARLELLRQYDILDTGADPAFDEITAQAAAACHTPVSMLGFVDRDRVWYKSAHGTQVREIPRDSSFCADTICQEGLYVARGPQADERFANSPFLKQQLRFYAGVPLLSPEGLALGALSVADREPRELTAEQIERLKALAKGTVLLLEVRRAGGRTSA